MTHRQRRSLAGLCALVLAACAHTHMTSQLNPEAADRRFSKVLAFAVFGKLDYRKAAEERLCSKIRDESGTECLEAEKVFFPGQHYSQDAMARRLHDLNVDGVLALEPAGSGTSSTYLPISSHTTGSASVSGNTVSGSSTTTTYGGYDIKKPWADYQVLLWATADSTTVWYATASSNGNGYAGWDDLIHSAADKTVSELSAAGLLLRRRKK